MEFSQKPGQYQQFQNEDQAGVVRVQPAPQITTTVITAQPNHRTWSTALCSCTDDVGLCCLVAFCGPCYECHFDASQGESCCLPCCAPLALMPMRTKIRTQHGIQGSIQDDCCVACCCGPCTLCQLKREVDYIARGNINMTTTVIQQQ